MRKFFLITLLLAVSSLSVAKSTNMTAIQGEVFSIQNFSQILIGLLFVLFIISVSAIVYKKLSGYKMSLNKAMSIVSVMSIGTREKIMLLKVGEKYLLVGVTPHNINSLHTFDQMPMLASVPEKNTSNFLSYLQVALKNKSSKVEVDSQQHKVK